ncbi:hypothetical protein [Dethiothermospora halolimnae]|uniref:hypothetical protein n=1 Tax=Dethiothermospora halolimnae TaxID=3114390 RepID=UPI003CCBCC1D
MNEIKKMAPKQKKSGPLSTNTLPLLMLPLLFMGPRFNNITQLSKSIQSISNNINLSNIDDLEKKVNTIKKVGPYLPEEMIANTNKLVSGFEKIVKIQKLIRVINDNNDFTPIEPISTSNSKERFSKIFNIIVEDSSNEQLKNIKPMVDMVTNIDKFKGLIDGISSLTGSSKKEVNFEEMIEAIIPLLGDNANINKDKIKEMVGMMELFKALNNDENET